jgi:hypothetical protein
MSLLQESRAAYHDSSAISIQSPLANKKPGTALSNLCTPTTNGLKKPNSQFEKKKNQTRYSDLSSGSEMPSEKNDEGGARTGSDNISYIKSLRARMASRVVKERRRYEQRH